MINRLVIIFLMLNSYLLQQEGIRVRINRSKIHMLISMFLRQINEKIVKIEKKFTKEDKDENAKLLNLESIEVQLIGKIEPPNIEIFEAQTDVTKLKLGIKDVNFEVNIKPDKTGLSKFKLGILKLEIEIGFKAWEEVESKKPLIEIKFLNLQPGQFSINAEPGLQNFFSGIINLVGNSAIKISNYIYQDKITEIFLTIVTSKINDLIEANYPESYEIPSLDVSINTLMTKRPEINQNQIILFIDGKFTANNFLSRSSSTPPSSNKPQVFKDLGPAAFAIDIIEPSMESFLQFFIPAKYGSPTALNDEELAIQSATNDFLQHNSGNGKQENSSFDPLIQLSLFPTLPIQIKGTDKQSEGGIYINKLGISMAAKPNGGNVRVKTQLSSLIKMEMRKKGKEKNLFGVHFTITDFQLPALQIDLSTKRNDELDNIDNMIIMNLDMDMETDGNSNNEIDYAITQFSFPAPIVVTDINVEYTDYFVTTSFVLEHEISARQTII